MQAEMGKSSTVIDPVCGMRVVPEAAAGHVRHEDKDYYFCSRGCATKFASAPDTYLNPKPQLVQIGMPKPHPLEPVPAAGEKIEYTCPMHPEVISDKPGPCPICGMALEPKTITAAPEDDSELR